MLPKPWSRQKRITDPAKLNTIEIDNLIKDDFVVVIQFSKACFSESLLEEINLLCAKYGPEFGVRFFGFYSSTFDFFTLRKISNVKNLAVDCLIKAENIEVLAELDNLIYLNFGVFEMKDFSILSYPNLKKLRQIFLGETFSGSYNLEPLSQFNDLETLTIQSHTKNIEAVAGLAKLKYLGLSSIKRRTLEFVNSVKSLKSLLIILGGRSDINEIGENEIEELEIIWVRGFCDLTNLERFRKLQKLYVENQIRLESLTFQNPMRHLSELSIINCNNFSSLKGLENLNSLTKLQLAMTNIHFPSFIEQKMPKTLEKMHFFTGKQRLNEKVHSEIRARGYSTER